MRLGWLTDIHLNFMQAPESTAFLDYVAEQNLDAALISGDIAEGDTLRIYMSMIARHLTCPVYFVLGNHDYYFGSIASIRRETRSICREHPHLHWLNDAGVVALDESVGLIGHDGWSDGRNGDFHGSDVLMNDFFLIDDLRDKPKPELLASMQLLADEAAEHFRRVLPEALKRHRRIILLTHVPPYREASRHEGEISNDYFLPHMSNRVVGETLCQVMAEQPDAELTVLCGHTHGKSEVRAAHNITVLTGGATYGQPEVQMVIEV